MKEKDIENKLFFTKNLLEWNKKSNKRAMPWKNEKDPYKIWISEIILQQTRVEQGLDYYNRFVKKFPDIKKLAKAPENEVFKLWEGLGYYSRCRNLIATARFIANELNGVFPDQYEDILALKGVGPYTAAAIASFAYNLPFAVVDGNVMRVLARFFEVNEPIDSTEGKKKFNILAQSLLKKEKAGIYNQAIMDLGATVCKPQAPDCKNCKLSSACLAFQHGTVLSYPVKSKSITIKERWFNYIIAEYDEAYYIRKRTDKDIWQELHEFILIESNQFLSYKEICGFDFFSALPSGAFELIHTSETYLQKLTHQHIKGQFFHIRLKQPLKNTSYQLKKTKQIKMLAFPRLIDNYLKTKNIVF